MKNQVNFIFLLLLGTAAFTLTGCAERVIPLASGAENVKVIDATAYPYNVALPHCQLRGEVISHFVTPYTQRDRTPTPNEIRVIKNKALVLGANIVIINHNAILVEGQSYDHVMLSNAYLCGIPLYNPALNPMNNNVAEDDTNE